MSSQPSSGPRTIPTAPTGAPAAPRRRRVPGAIVPHGTAPAPAGGAATGTPPVAPPPATGPAAAPAAAPVTSAGPTTAPWWKKKEALWAAIGLGGVAVGTGIGYHLNSGPQTDIREAIIQALEAEALEKPQTKIRVQGYVHRIGNDLVVTMAYPSLVVDNCGKAHEAHPSVVGVRPAASGNGMLEGTLVLQLHNVHGQTIMYRGDDLLVGGGGQVNGFSMDAILLE